jgi:hypothetical protein
MHDLSFSFHFTFLEITMKRIYSKAGIALAALAAPTVVWASQACCEMLECCLGLPCC